MTYQGNGTQVQFDFPFDYLRKSFVKVTVDDTPVTNFVVDNRSVVFDTPPKLNSIIVIYRETSTERLVSWSDASVLRASDMTISQIQQLHIIEESKEWAIVNSMVLNENDEWEGRFHKIVNVTDPTEPQDVVTKHYMETVQGGFVQENTKLKNEATKQAQIATTKANEAKASQTAAKTSETNAKTSETNAKASENTAKEWATKIGSAVVAEENLWSAKHYASFAEKKAKEATDKASEAQASQSAAKTSETNAKASETAAKTSQTAAKTSETNAKSSETKAGTSATTATQQATKATTEANRAKSEADRAKTAADSVGNPVVEITQSNGNLTITKGDNSTKTLKVTPTIATQAEAEAGADNTKMMTPLRVLQAIKKFISAFLMTAVFTGIIKGVTPPDNANDKTIPTTEWVQKLVASKVMSLIVQDYLLEQNGYVRFKFGLILQWGATYLNATDSNVTVPLNISYTQQHFTVVEGTEWSSTGADMWNIGLNSLTLNNFKACNTTRSKFNLFWISLGK